MSTLIFDCDGVLADTERFGHLPAFNATFEDHGLPVRWDEEEYGRRLRIGGGKERMASLFTDPGFVVSARLPDGEDTRAALLVEWHRTKTAHFTRMIHDGLVPARPGVSRVIGEALDAGWKVAVASTSAEESVRAVLVSVVGSARSEVIPVYAGDIVPTKKPDPAIYLLAVASLGADPADTLVVEDSRNGLRAAAAAGLPCLVTINGYTRGESFEEASLVVSDLGDPEGPLVHVVADRADVRPGAFITLEDMSKCIRAGAGHRGGSTG